MAITIILLVIVIALGCYIGSVFVRRNIHHVRRAIHHGAHNLHCEQCDAKLPYDDTAGDYANICPKCGTPQSWAQEKLPWED